MSDSAAPSILIASRHVYIDDTLLKLVEEHDPRAAMLLAPKGMRLSAAKLTRFENGQDFFLEPDEYHRENPPQNTTLLTSYEGTEGGSVIDATTEEVEDLNAGNSVVVEHVGDPMSQEEQEQPQPGVSTARKRRRN